MTTTTAATTATGPRTIRRNATRQIAAIRAAVTRCTIHNLANNFEAKEVDVAAAFADLAEYDFARLTEDKPGRKWTVHIHSNRWYTLTAAEQQSADEGEQAPESPVDTARRAVETTKTLSVSMVNAVRDARTTAGVAHLPAATNTHTADALLSRGVIGPRTALGNLYVHPLTPMGVLVLLALTEGMAVVEAMAAQPEPVDVPAEDVPAGQSDEETGAGFEIGDVVRTPGGRSDRVVVGISPRTPVERYDAAMARFEAGRGVKPRDFATIATRALRDGKPFGPELHTRPSRLTLVRRAGEQPAPVDPDRVVVVRPDAEGDRHDRELCGTCGNWPTTTYLDGDGVRRYSSHRNPTDYPAWCDASDEPMPAEQGGDQDATEDTAPAGEQTEQDPDADLTALGAGVLVEAVPSGITRHGDPITRPIRRRLDRAPWGYDAERGTVVVSDGTGADVVNVDSIRILETAPPPAVAEDTGPAEHVVDGRAVDPPRNTPHPAARRLVAAEWSQAARRVGGDDYTHAADDLTPYLDSDPAAAADLAAYFHPDTEPVSSNDNAASNRPAETGDDDQ